MLGVSGQLQGLLNARESLDREGYAAWIIGIVSDESINIIFEEASGRGRIYLRMIMSR